MFAQRPRFVNLYCPHVIHSLNARSPAPCTRGGSWAVSTKRSYRTSGQQDKPWRRAQRFFFESCGHFFRTVLILAADRPSMRNARMSRSSQNGTLTARLAVKLQATTQTSISVPSESSPIHSVVATTFSFSASAGTTMGPPTNSTTVMTAPD